MYTLPYAQCYTCESLIERAVEQSSSSTRASPRMAHFVDVLCSIVVLTLCSSSKCAVGTGSFMTHTSDRAIGGAMKRWWLNKYGSCLWRINHMSRHKVKVFCYPMSNNPFLPFFKKFRFIFYFFVVAARQRHLNFGIQNFKRTVQSTKKKDVRLYRKWRWDTSPLLTRMSDERYGNGKSGSGPVQHTGRRGIFRKGADSERAQV